MMLPTGLPLNGRSPRFAGTAILSDVLKESSAPPDGELEAARDIYLPSADTKSPHEGRKLIRWNPASRTDIKTPSGFRRLMHWEPASKKAIADINLITADNIVRDRIYYTPPGTLENQLKKKWQTDTADLLVIGAGPAGLATALHATKSGLKTLLTDGGYAFQSFSDQSMQPVHVMRTNAIQSSLTNAETSPKLHGKFGMPAHLAEYRHKGALARELMQNLTGRKYIGNPPDARDPWVERPVARNELFQYFDRILEEISGSRNGFVLEQSPVVPPTQEKDDVFTLQTLNGHTLRAQNIALAIGAVGLDGQYARENPVFRDAAFLHPDKYVSLGSRSDLAPKNERLAGILDALKKHKKPREQLLISDPLIGSREVSAIISHLPKGTRCMVVGGGESAAKSVIELFNLNPDIQVDWMISPKYQKDQPYQLQVLDTNTRVDVMTRCMQDPSQARESIRKWKEDLGVPITPQTEQDLDRKKAEGRLTVHNLIRKINPAFMQLVPVKTSWLSNKTETEVRVKTTAPNGRQTWNPLSRIDGVLISAIGYDRRNLRRDNDLLQSWFQQGLISPNHSNRHVENELELAPNSLASASHPNIYPVGACNWYMAADSALFGMPVRAAKVVDDILRKKQKSEPSGTPLIVDDRLRKNQNAEPSGFIGP